MFFFVPWSPFKASMFLLWTTESLTIIYFEVFNAKRNQPEKNLMIFMTRMSKDTVANCERDDSREKKLEFERLFKWKIRKFLNIEIVNTQFKSYWHSMTNSNHTLNLVLK